MTSGTRKRASSRASKSARRRLEHELACISISDSRLPGSSANTRRRASGFRSSRVSRRVACVAASLRHRMPDVGHRDARLFVERRLEQETARASGRRCGRSCASVRAATPTPTGSRECTVRTPRRFSFALEPEVEVGRVDADETAARRHPAAAARSCAADAEQLAAGAR